jgi:hypothetical protein
MEETSLLDNSDYIELCDRIKQADWIVKGKIGEIGRRI